MTPTTKEEALAAVWAAPDEVRPTLMKQMEIHLAARQQALHALDARVTQAAVILMAAAAVAVTIVLGSDADSAGAKWLAGATVAFAIAGGVCMGALRSNVGVFPGATLGWWNDSPNLGSFSAKDADYALAGYQHKAMDDLARAAERRARTLNLGVRIGFGGALLVGIAAVSHFI